MTCETGPGVHSPRCPRQRAASACERVAESCGIGVRCAVIYRKGCDGGWRMGEDAHSSGKRGKQLGVEG